MSAIRLICIAILSVGIFVYPSAGRPNNERQSHQIADANNYFGIDLYKHLTGNGNVFFSPLSISSALSMLYLGAHGTTEVQMKNALGFNYANLKRENVHPAFRKMLDRLQSSPKEYILDVANKVLARDDLKVKSSYKTDLEKYYEAEVEESDFMDSGAIVSKINTWVQEKTHGKIGRLLNQLDPSDVLVLLNAVYFKGTWKTKFEKESTKDESFYNSGEKEVKVPMMNLKSRFPYADSADLNSKVLELPYSGENISMVIILPNDRKGLSELEASLTAETLGHAVRELYTSTVIVKFPKFKLEETYGLNGVLSDLGMKEIFGPRADFSGVAERPVAVSSVVHKAFVEVNEEGSEAAAVTGIFGRIRPSINPPEIYEFVADHPFIFMIRERPTGMILFMGKVQNF